MAPKGTFTAYQQAYADKPINYGKEVGDAVGAGIDSAVKAKNDREAKEERLKKEKLARDEKNEKHFGDAAKRISVQDGAPPSAQTIASLGGDQLHSIIKDLPPGVDRGAAVERVIRKSQQAVDAITSAALSLEAAPGDAFASDGGFYNLAKNMLEGDLTYSWVDGDLMVQGTGKDGQPVNMSLDEFTNSITPPDGLQAINSGEANELLIKEKKDKNFNLNTREGQDAFRRTAIDVASQYINAENGAAAARYIYNNAEELGLDGVDKKNFLEIGKILQSGADLSELSEEAQQYINKFLPKAQQLYGQSLVGELPAVAKTGGGGKTPPFQGFGGDDLYVSETRDILGNTLSTEDTTVVTNDLINTDPFSDEDVPESLSNLGEVSNTLEATTITGDDGNTVLNISWDTQDAAGFGFGFGKDERSGSGSIEINGETVEFSSFEDLKQKLPDLLQGEGKSTVTYFEGGDYIVEQDHNKITDNLNSVYANLPKGVEFEADKGGKIQLTKAGKIIQTFNFDRDFPLPKKSDYANNEAGYKAALEDVKASRRAAVEIELSIL